MKVIWTVVGFVLVVLGAAVSGQDELCEDRADFSLVRHYEFCYRYFICINGDAYLMRCNGDLWFDEETQSCRSQELVSCAVEDPSTPAPVPGICDDVEDNQLVIHPDFCNTYFICIGQQGTVVVCSLGLWFDPEQQLCANPSDFECPHGPIGASRCRTEENFALVPSDVYCNRYYQCVHGYSYPMLCPDGQWFDTTSDSCRSETEVECDLETIEPDENPTFDVCDLQPNNFLTANPTVCNKYYVCINQLGWSKMCPLGMWFDATGQTCVPPGSTDCPLGPPMPPETTTTPFTRCDGVPNLAYVTGDEFCYRYFQCRDGVPFPIICRDGLWFSEEAQQCVEPETTQCDLDDSEPPTTPTPGICTDVTDGVLVRHPLDCNQYYLCVGQVGVPTICPTGLWFDEPNQMCSNPVNVDCPHGPTTPAPDPFAVCENVFEYRFVRDEEYCYRYVQCIGGTPYPLVCHDGLWFDQERQTCDRSEYVECDGFDAPDVRPPDYTGICEDVDDGMLAPHDTFCNEYFLCVRGVGWPIICPLGLWFDVEQQTCSVAGQVQCHLAPERPPVTESPYARCSGIPENAYVRDPDYCYRYYKCVSGSPFPMICPSEQWFDERQQSCRNATEVSCPIEEEQTRPPPTPGVCTGVADSVQVPNRRACNQFYTCVDQAAFPQICAYGLWFNEAAQTCSPPTETTCDLGPATTTTTAPHPWALCDDVPNYSYVPSPNYCYRFFQCIDGAPFPMHCGGSLWFDRERQICAEPQEVTCIVNPNPPVVPPTPGICTGQANGRQVSSPRACNQFYVCVDEIGYALVCPENLWFDEFHQICSPPSSTYCPLAPVVTTPSPYERCIDVSNFGMVRNDFYCYRYFQCVDDIPYPMICRAGYWFDLERQMCDLSLNVQCELRPGNPGPIIPTPAICEGTSDGSFERNWSFCNQYYLCVGEEAFPQICPDGLWFDDHRETCDLPANVYCPLGASTAEPIPEQRCYGVPDLSFLANDIYCYRYYHCVDGISYPMICGSHLWFSLDSQSCESVDVIDCDGETRPPDVPPTEGICTGLENGRQVLHPDFCNQFYVCIEGVGFSQICPFGLWFDDELQSCASPPDVECPYGLQPTLSPIDNICSGMPDGAKIANPTDCAWFYICISDEPFRSPCPEDMLFDRNQLQCVPADEAECAEEGMTSPLPGPCYGIADYTLVRNPYNCASYYECLNGYGHPSYCPPGQYFSEELQRCDLAENVDCSVEEGETTTEEDADSEEIFKSRRTL
ncbi:uncharacterized protein LOC129729757 [Wyeomyia smithii]|uniref:uncharacterized protein LOC129729757 n=1 Tax=Wyeomyia smithii TaxID=174621 RepID=UPI002467DD6E|nr:uncharacterized protein LOC129729757 [Wyeomyia smithii]